MAKRVLVDTNVLSLLIRYKLGRLEKNPEAIAKAIWYAAQIQGKELIRSFATDAELRRWVLSREDPKDRERVEGAILHTFNTTGCIHSTEAVSESWAHLANQAKGRLPLTTPAPINSGTQHPVILPSLRCRPLRERGIPI